MPQKTPNPKVWLRRSTKFGSTRRLERTHSIRRQAALVKGRYQMKVRAEGDLAPANVIVKLQDESDHVISH